MFLHTDTHVRTHPYTDTYKHSHRHTYSAHSKHVNVDVHYSGEYAAVRRRWMPSHSPAGVTHFSRVRALRCQGEALQPGVRVLFFR